MIEESPGFLVTVNVVYSLVFGIVAYLLMPKAAKLLLESGQLLGRDLNKKGHPVIPESLGVFLGATFMVCMSLFIPIPFASQIIQGSGGKGFQAQQSPQLQVQDIQESINSYIWLSSYLGGMLSISCMIFLGFADDVLNLRWRDKLFLPAIASLPLLMVYYVTVDRTVVVVPILLRAYLGQTIDLGFLYYIYMGMLAVFCTNAINILAGINGLEVGQSIIISAFIICYNAIEIHSGGDSVIYHYHLFSLLFLCPFFSLSVALLFHNWCPAKVFVGDTYCYFAGMTFAVVGILGHFSKTMILFFLPQIFNFLFSAPQLFHVIPCPRHRMPRFNPETGLLEPSMTPRFKTNGILRMLIVKFCITFRLVKLVKSKEDGQIEISNMTLINLILYWVGPLEESKLCLLLLVVQGISCSIGLAFRLIGPHLFF